MKLWTKQHFVENKTDYAACFYKNAIKQIMLHVFTQMQ